MRHGDRGRRDGRRPSGRPRDDQRRDDRRPDRRDDEDRGERRPSDEGALVARPIDPQQLVAAVANPTAGATVLFVGTARGVTDGVETRALLYEAHEAMAGPAIERLCTATVDRFQLAACAVEHRLGRVPAGEATVAVATAAAHRQAAFEAAAWLMERIKHDVPIWKCEERADGSREWVHAGDMTKPGAGA